MNLSIENPQSNNNTLSFVLSGDEQNGLDVSVVNSIRRILLSEIPTVAFRTDEGTNLDIKMEVNKTSLHNEFILHRISLIPLFINPQEFNRDLLFHLSVKHDGTEPFKFVTSEDFNIYHLKEDLDPDIDLSILDINNYDLKNKLSNTEKNNLLRPFKDPFNKNDSYIMITELKNTNTPDTYQELSFYGVPSISVAKEHARWQSVSTATYTYVKNDELFKQVAKDKCDIKGITNEEEREKFINSLELSESERYYYKDVNGEPFKYEFNITSCHYHTSKDLFLQANEIMIQKLKMIKDHLIMMIKGEESSILVKTHTNTNDEEAENVYDFIITEQDDTLGNVLQSHIVKNFITDKSLISFCGYKRSHPLEEFITLTIGVNPTNKAIDGKNDEQKVTAIVQSLDNIIEDIIKIYDEIIKIGSRVL